MITAFPGKCDGAFDEKRHSVRANTTLLKKGLAEYLKGPTYFFDLRIRAKNSCAVACAYVRDSPRRNNWCGLFTRASLLSVGKACTLDDLDE